MGSVARERQMRQIEGTEGTSVGDYKETTP